jgi:hypothetical protein
VQHTVAEVEAALGEGVCEGGARGTCFGGSSSWAADQSPSRESRKWVNTSPRKLQHDADCILYHSWVLAMGRNWTCEASVWLLGPDS